MIRIEGTLEILIPFLMTKLIAEGLSDAGPDMGAIVRIGLAMLVMALAALLLLSGKGIPRRTIHHTVLRDG